MFALSSGCDRTDKLSKLAIVMEKNIFYNYIIFETITQYKNDYKSTHISTSLKNVKKNIFQLFKQVLQIWTNSPIIHFNSPI